MKPSTRILYTLLLLLVIGSVPRQVLGQHWTADEQSLIEAIRYCWSGLAEEPISYDTFEARCRPTEETTYWYLPDVVPEILGSGWREGLFESLNRKALSQDLRPLRVRVEGEFGFIWLVGIRLWELTDGSRDVELFRSFEIWQRTPDGWSFFGGMGTPENDAGHDFLESGR